MSEEAKRILAEIALSPRADATKQNLVRVFQLVSKRAGSPLNSEEEKELAVALQQATDEIAGLSDMKTEKERTGIILDLGAEILRQFIN